MFYVYSNDTATILNAKKEEEKWLMENSKLRSNACSNGAMFWDVNDKGSEIKN
jgi:hypothetical protein